MEDAADGSIESELRDAEELLALDPENVELAALVADLRELAALSAAAAPLTESEPLDAPPPAHVPALGEKVCAPYPTPDGLHIYLLAGIVSRIDETSSMSGIGVEAAQAAEQARSPASNEPLKGELNSATDADITGAATAKESSEATPLTPSIVSGPFVSVLLLTPPTSDLANFGLHLAAGYLLPYEASLSSALDLSLHRDPTDPHQTTSDDLKPGARVWARFYPRGSRGKAEEAWYPATVRAVQGGGATYRVVYEGYEKEGEGVLGHDDVFPLVDVGLGGGAEGAGDGNRVGGDGEGSRHGGLGYNGDSDADSHVPRKRHWDGGDSESESDMVSSGSYDDMSDESGFYTDDAEDSDASSSSFRPSFGHMPNPPLPPHSSSHPPLAEWESHTRGIASRLMLRMGFVPGTGLGKDGQGRVEPVEVEIRGAGWGLDYREEETHKGKRRGGRRKRKDADGGRGGHGAGGRRRGGNSKDESTGDGKSNVFGFLEGVLNQKHQRHQGSHHNHHQETQSNRPGTSGSRSKASPATPPADAASAARTTLLQLSLLLPRLRSDLVRAESRLAANAKQPAVRKEYERMVGEIKDRIERAEAKEKEAERVVGKGGKAKGRM
ncbi:hypothetical protein M427DRAFT_55169 [Gonapodya prolifera JEL478]|uniref:G-patch domain-containing protein n=1 Tax=Gonapodya prolifera (strain JEL478) TaxID=1344416 RepID=A0A139AJ60_GONPJ|nr:hypothetical protein M427DRAFT_55169 [Gonapodya prolifera JEL478]|eukprot:KXS16826.1 hypothetical protein M427DRAFT_55169 [Gonapodya prolifera JEL478]